MKEIMGRIKEFERKEWVADVELIALVTDTSREVIFYGDIDGVRYQSNAMVEKGKLPGAVVEGFYEEITALIRGDARFKPDKLNVIKADSDRLKVEYEDRLCSRYGIIRKWQESLP